LIRRVASLGTLVVLLVGGSAVGAQGAYKLWANPTAPLRVEYDHSVGWGFGAWTVSSGSDGTRSRLGANVAMSYPFKGRKVFAKLTTWVNAGYCISPDFVTCSMKYYYYDQSDTKHVQSIPWYYVSTTTGVPGGADYARAEIQVKLDIPWKPDPASNSLFTTGVKY
jgi:hypothetical protein